MKMSKIESAIRVGLAYYDVINRHDSAAMAELMTDDCTLYASGPAPDGAVYEGKETVTEHWQESFDRSPNAQIEIEEIFGMGKRCVALWQYEVPLPSGETRRIRGVNIIQERDGLISEIHSYVKA